MLRATSLLLAWHWLATAPLANARTPAWLHNNSHFVRVHNGTFTLGCRRFPVAGWNQWEVVEMGAGMPALYGGSLPPGMTGPALLRRILDDAAAAGLTVMRAWAHGVQPGAVLQVAPGRYNQELLRGLDYAMDQARARGIRVVEWTGIDALQHHSRFFVDAQARMMYKAHVRFMLTRTNMVNGIPYAQDPTVFAWGLINEPRCSQCASNTLSAWIDEMAAFVKSLAPNHMVTVGSEGFYHSGRGLHVNPGEWAASEGQHFLWDHASPHVDFATVHLWPSNWQSGDEGFVTRWLQHHQHDAALLGKPLLVEEFGGHPHDRPELYSTVYTAVHASVLQGGPLQGALFWRYYADGQEAPLDEGGGAGISAVTKDDPTWLLVMRFAADMEAAGGKRLETCDDAGPVASEPTQCPAGFEGPDCFQDIDECVRGLQVCSPAEVCVNSRGSAACVCPPLLMTLPADVVAGGQQLGAGGVVQLNECLAACLMARRCTDVSFNASPVTSCSTASYSYAVSPTGNELVYDCGSWQSWYLERRRGRARRPGQDGRPANVLPQ